MGTHIDCLIPKEKDYSLAEVKLKLKNVYERLKPSYSHIEKHGNFIKNVSGNWCINLILSENGQPEYITGEGDSFSIDIYKKVICIGCIERFSSLHTTEKKLSSELLKIFREIRKEFTKSNEMLIGAGGLGETDQIIDMAFYKNADFSQICKKMKELYGIPATQLTELKNKPWYLEK